MILTIICFKSTIDYQFNTSNLFYKQTEGRADYLKYLQWNDLIKSELTKLKVSTNSGCMIAV